MTPERLLAGAADLGITLTEAQQAAFVRYFHALADWNRRVNLTSVDDWEGVQTVHFLDSLSVAAALPRERARRRPSPRRGQRRGLPRPAPEDRLPRPAPRPPRVRRQEGGVPACGRRPPRPPRRRGPPRSRRRARAPAGASGVLRRGARPGPGEDARPRRAHAALRPARGRGGRAEEGRRRCGAGRRPRRPCDSSAAGPSLPAGCACAASPTSGPWSARPRSPPRPTATPDAPVCPGSGPWAAGRRSLRARPPGMPT